MILPPSFKINFGTIVLISPHPAHSIRYNFTNNMDRQYPVGSIRRPSNSGGGDEDRPEFIRCVDGRETHIHEVWNFGEDGVTCEVHPTSGVGVGTGFVGEFVTN